MINFALGIIIGLLLAIVCMLSVRRYQVPLERTAKRLENFTKERGEVYVESDEKQDFEAFINNLPKE